VDTALESMFSSLMRLKISPEELVVKVFGGAALQILENTCRVWRSDGPLMEALKERIEKGK